MKSNTTKRRLSTPVILVIIVFVAFVCTKIFKEAANDVQKTKQRIGNQK